MRAKSILLRLSFIALVALIGFAIYQLWNINQDYTQEAAMYNQVQQYRPAFQASASSADIIPVDTLTNSTANETDTDTNVAASIMLNQDIVELQARYADTLGWLTIPNTQIDHPFVQGGDNEHYLHTDLEQNRSSAGTLFMDYRNSKDFTDFNTIIFGHNMRNGSMFGSLRNFNDQDFFNDNGIGMLFLRDKTYEIEIFAFAVIRHNDGIIYNPRIATESEKAEFLEHIKDSARYYRDIGVTTDDRVVVLSTCNYEFYDARMVVIARIADTHENGS